MVIMKKLIYTSLILLTVQTLSAQMWVEAFGVYTSPLEAFTSKGTRVIDFNSGPVKVVDQTFFKDFADPGYGIGINLRYRAHEKAFIVGMEMSYAEYGASTQYTQFTMFRIGPIGEYYFIKKSNFTPYVGGEIGLQQVRAIVLNNELDTDQLSDTYFAGGLRGGFIYTFHRQWAIRLGGKYMMTGTFPYFDISLGVAYNLGDF